MDAVTKSGSGGVSAIVEYDYTAKEPDELDLVKGALIHNIKQMPGGWWEGTLQSNGKMGMFPDNFVRVVEMSDENTVVLRDKSTTPNRRCKVIYSYTQVNDDELSLAVGDVIEFLGEVEEGWWRGRLRSKVGVFPSNFVVAIEPSPIFASKRPPSSAAVAAAVAAATLPATTTMFASKSSASSSTITANNTSAMPVNNTTSTLSSSSSTASASNKKSNRLSFHSSKENLLSSTSGIAATTTTATTAAITAGDELAPTLPPKPWREYCRVEFPYAPQNEDELELKTGEIIKIISIELPDKGWWKGELNGKVGVFPDNFVKLLPNSVSPLHDAHFANKTTKHSNVSAGSATTSTTSSSLTTSTTAATAITSATAAATSLSSSSTATTIKANHASSATRSKVIIKKSASSSSSQSSERVQASRKDSFGSRDSLDDILSETGLQSGNVAAARKSLENKNIDLLNAPDANSRLALKKMQQQETVTTTTTVSSISSNNSSEMRKSIENLDEKTKTPPPVLTKKPLIGGKGILSGFKMKMKNVEKQLTSAVSHDFADGIASSKISPPSGAGLPEAGMAGNVVIRRAATIAVEDTDFDSVERASILPDMRAGRVKAPRRRPPSASFNAGENNNNSSSYLNGSSENNAEESSNKPHSSDENSTSDEQLLAKPKPREWQTQKAPWMEELKVSQMKKKTSPNVEPRSNNADAANTTATSNSTTTIAKERSKNSIEDVKISSSANSGASTASSNTSYSVSSTTTTQTTKLQSSSISSTLMQQSVVAAAESSQQQLQPSISKNMMQTSKTSDEDVRMRPNSLSIRNRSCSPAAASASAGRSSSGGKITAIPAASSASSSAAVEANSSIITTSNASSSTSSHHINHQTSTNSISSTLLENNLPASSKQGQHQNISSINASSAANGSNVESTRIQELERRVDKLESVVHSQQRTIDELVRTLREETDRVKLLRGELDKYAQCVTQV